MISLTLKEIAQAVNGQLIGIDNAQSERVITEIVTDSRAVNSNELQNNDELLFLALKGPNFDGHRFVEQISQLGCQAMIVDHPLTLENQGVAQIIVSDTRIALGQIGAYVKQQVAPKTVGITGSSGKTTVKEMIAAILSQLGNVLATKGNFNNDIGVPLTLLRLEKTHDFAVIEMGANHLGEIAYTSELVKPDVALINNVAAAHLEGFGNLEGVARAKGEIFSDLNEQGIAIYNRDSQFAEQWLWRIEDKIAQQQVKTFSCASAEATSEPNINSSSEADCYSSKVILDDNGCASFTLHTPIGDAFIELAIPGQHNVCNAVAAASVALAFNASLDDIRLGLAKMSAVKGRLNLYQLDRHLKLIDDTYNANVESVKAATQLLSTYVGKRILILGDMGELGEDARGYHQEAGEYAQQLHIDTLLTLGVLSQSTTDAFAAKTHLEQNPSGESHHFSVRANLLEHVFTLLNDNWQNLENNPISILVKGSRSAHMEYVVQEIIDWCDDKKTSQLEEVNT